MSDYEQVAVTVPGGSGDGRLHQPSFGSLVWVCMGPGTTSSRKQIGANVQKRWGVKFVPGGLVGCRSIELPQSIY